MAVAAFAFAAAAASGALLKLRDAAPEGVPGAGVEKALRDIEGRGV